MIMKRPILFFELKLIVSVIIIVFFTSCNNQTAGSSNAKSTKQEETFLSVFKIIYTRDSAFYPAFNQAFTQAYGADSLQHYNQDRGLPTVEVTSYYDLNGLKKGQFVVAKGATLHVSGMLLGGIQINGGKVENDGVIVGNVVNQGGEFTDNGLLQGALMTKPMH